MGTEIQSLGLSDEAFRGDRFCDHGCDLAGNNELLTLTQPDAMREIHLRYFLAGADIAETNTFSANRVSQGDYDTVGQVVELNEAAARLAREAAEEAHGIDGRRRFVAGAVGPTNMTLSLSPKVEDPGYRAITFGALADAYQEQIEALIRGGVDALLIETIFDTLNAKAAIVASRRAMHAHGTQLPLMISGTITDRSGRTLSGQTPAAFWQSVRHAQPLTVGLNCALGAEEMRPHLQELATVADTFVCAYPNAGLPNELGGYDETPAQTAAFIGEFAEAGLLNVVGGCCGTTPAHIEAIARTVEGKAPRVVPTRTPRLELSGLEPFALTDDIPFVNVGERTNITGSAKFRRLIKDNEYGEALVVALQQVESGAQIIDVNMDDGLIDGVEAMTTFLNLIASEPDIAKVPIMIDSSKFEVIEAGLKCVQGKPIVNSISMKEGEEAFLAQARTCLDYGAAVIVMAFDEIGQADTVERKVDIARRAYHLLVNEVGFPPEDIIIDPNIFAVATGIEEHNRYGLDFIEATKTDHRRAAARQHLRWRVEPVVLVPWQRAGTRGHALGVPVEGGRSGNADGHRERRPARRVRPDRSGAARAVRGRRARPPSGRHRTAARRGRPLCRQRCRGRRSRRRRVAFVGRRSSHRPRPGQRHHRVHRGRRRRGAGGLRTRRRRDRRTADERYEHRRRPVRRRQDVPPAGRQVGPRDEAGSRLLDPVHRGRR